MQPNWFEAGGSPLLRKAAASKHSEEDAEESLDSESPEGAEQTEDSEEERCAFFLEFSCDDLVRG